MDILTEEEAALVRETDEVGFLPDFIAWAGKKTDAPAYALQTAALMALSLSCGDVYKLNSPIGPIYLNLYIMLVGPSTTMRKTTVLNYVTDLLPSLSAGSDGEAAGDYLRVLDDVSAQAFNKAVAKAGDQKLPVLLNVDEVSGLFEVLKKKGSYLAGFDKVLMRCYDHTPVHVDRTNAVIQSKDGAFTAVFAASTPEPLMEALGGDDIASGLLPRFLYFTTDGADKRPRRSFMARMADSEDWEDEADRLKGFLRTVAHDRVNNITGDYKVTTLEVSPEAMVRLDAIDETFTSEVAIDEDGWAAIKGRGLWHIFKLAALYAVSRQGRDATIELIDVLRAAHLVEILLTDIGTMQDKVGTNATERQIETIMEYLRLSTGVVQSQRQVDIARRMKLTARELRDLVQTMMLRGLITVAKNDNGELIWVMR